MPQLARHRGRLSEKSACQRPQGQPHHCSRDDNACFNIEHALRARTRSESMSQQAQDNEDCFVLEVTGFHNILHANVGFTCKRGLRGLCDSTRRDRLVWQVQAFVRRSYFLGVVSTYSCSMPGTCSHFSISPGTTRKNGCERGRITALSRSAHNWSRPATFSTK